jgi:hypothetical protein
VESLRSIYSKNDSIHYSTLDVGRSMLDVHQFLLCSDWPFFQASGRAHMKLFVVGNFHRIDRRAAQRTQLNIPSQRPPRALRLNYLVSFSI